MGGDFCIMDITRRDIIAIFERTLLPDERVQAFWLEGADAQGTVDDYSDLDLWLDVIDGYEEAVLAEIRDILLALSPLDFYHERHHPHPQLRQAFIHLSGTSPFLVIDLCIQSHSRQIAFTRQHVDEVVQVIFDKSDVIRWRDVDEKLYQSDLRARVRDLLVTFPFFLIWVTKGIRRDNYLEALSYYQNLVLKPLVELCRICYCPTKKDFYLKHIQRDLPNDLVRTLTDLHRVTTLADIQDKTVIAEKLFWEIAEEVSQNPQMEGVDC